MQSFSPNRNPDSDIFVPHLSQEMRELYGNGNATFSDKDKAVFECLEEAVIKFGDDCSKHLLSLPSGFDRFGLPVLWDTYQSADGVQEAVKVQFRPGLNFGKQIILTRFRDCEVFRKASAMASEDVEYEANESFGFKIRSAKLIKSALQAIGIERESMQDADGLPFRLALKENSRCEVISISIGKTDHVHFTIERPQAYEVYFWYPKLASVTVSAPLQAMRAPDFQALHDEDWRLLSSDDEKKDPLHPEITYDRDGNDRERVQYNRKPQSQDLLALQETFKALTDWRNQREF